MQAPQDTVTYLLRRTGRLHPDFHVHTLPKWQHHVEGAHGPWSHFQRDTGVSLSKEHIIAGIHEAVAQREARPPVQSEGWRRGREVARPRGGGQLLQLAAQGAAQPHSAAHTTRHVKPQERHQHRSSWPVHAAVAPLLRKVQPRQLRLYRAQVQLALWNTSQNSGATAKYTSHGFKLLVSTFDHLNDSCFAAKTDKEIQFFLNY